MINTIVWGFDPFEEVVDSLKSKDFNVVMHFVATPTKENQYSYNDLHSGQSLPKISATAPLAIKSTIANQFLQDYLIFNTRQSSLLYADLNIVYRDSIGDFHLFFYLIDVFYDIIAKHNINLVVFSNIPHEGADYILYYVAKQLKVRTIICYQTLFDNRFFILNSITDLGDLQASICELEEPLKIEIKNEFEKKLHYMNIVEDIHKQKHKVVQKLEHTKRKIPKMFWKLLRRKFTWTENLILQYCAAKIRIRNMEQYAKILAENETKNIDLSKKFVYFPLQLQPESTTTPLGGKYYDQISAVEKLSSVLPEDFLIYVKENPKQTELMRPKEFFARLMLIKNVVLVPITTNTYELTKNCQFVSTLTGTAGWEAITGGKNVLTFGYAWYNNLPGVFKYDQTKNIDEILNYKIDHEELKNKFFELSKRMPKGFVDKEFIEYTELRYDGVANGNDIASAIKKFWSFSTPH